MIDHEGIEYSGLTVRGGGHEAGQVAVVVRVGARHLGARRLARARVGAAARLTARARTLRL